MSYSHRHTIPARRSEERHRAMRPTGRYAQILDLIGYGKGPMSPQAAALAAS